MEKQIADFMIVMGQMPTFVPLFMGNLLNSLIVLVVFWFLYRLCRSNWIANRLLALKVDSQTVNTLGGIISHILRLLILVIGVLTMASQWGVDLMPVVASLGVFSMALALAAQDTVKNFFGVLVILVEGTFHVGDRISVNGITGVVEKINARSTQIRTEDGHLVYIPNANLSGSVITKYSK